MDNAGYAETGTASQARAFVTSCRFLILKTPKSMGVGSENMMLNPELIQKQQEAAEAWLASHSSDEGDAGPRVTRPDFGAFR